MTAKMNDHYKPTAHLQFVLRQSESVGKRVVAVRTLQQWWAPPMPDYMQSSEGEWRDVPLAEAP